MENRDKRGLPLPNEEKRSSTTQFSYDAATRRVGRKQRRLRIARLSYSLLCFLSFLYLVLYFSLPSFQAKNRKVDGLNVFKREDIVTLSGNGGYKPAVFFSPLESRDMLLTQSDGFLLSVGFSSDGFSVRGEVVENAPKGKIHDSVYYGNGLSAKEREAKLALLPLSSSRKEEISLAYKEREDSLPLLHLPSGLREENYKDAFKYLNLLPLNVLSCLSDVDFYSSDSNWNNLASLVFYDGESKDYFLFPRLRMDRRKTYFPSSDAFGKILSSCRREVAKQDREKSSYSPSDGEGEAKMVYAFSLIIDSSGKVKRTKA